MRTTLSLWSRMALAAFLVSPMASLPTADAFAADGATRPGTNPDQPGKKKPPAKKKKGGKKGKPKGPKMKGPFEKDEYPIQEQYRPLVLPNGMGEVTIAPAYTRADDLGATDFVTTAADFGATDFVTTAVDFDFGLGDLVELGVGTGMEFAPDVDWSNEIHAHVHWLAVDEKTFDLAPGVVVPFNFLPGGSQSVQLDALGRYLFADRFFVTFGRSVFDLGVNPDFTLTMNANGGIGVQAGKPTVLWLDTTVFSVPIAPDPAISGPWERLALSIGGQYTPVKTFDLGLVLSYADTWELADESTFGARLYARIRF